MDTSDEAPPVNTASASTAPASTALSSVTNAVQRATATPTAATVSAAALALLRAVNANASSTEAKSEVGTSLHAQAQILHEAAALSGEARFCRLAAMALEHTTRRMQAPGTASVSASSAAAGTPASSVAPTATATPTTPTTEAGKVTGEAQLSKLIVEARRTAVKTSASTAAHMAAVAAVRNALAAVPVERPAAVDEGRVDDVMVTAAVVGHAMAGALAEDLVRAIVQGKVVLHVPRLAALTQELQKEQQVRVLLALVLASTALGRATHSAPGAPAAGSGSGSGSAMPASTSAMSALSAGELRPGAASSCHALALDSLCRLLPSCETPLLCAPLARLVFAGGRRGKRDWEGCVRFRLVLSCACV